MRAHVRVVCALTLIVVALQGIGSRPARANVPFVVTQSAGPAAGSQVIATVTRRVGHANVTLPAALVPALVPGDIVDADFPDYRPPRTNVHYHDNVAFITETAPQHWLFERSGPADHLFSFTTGGKHGRMFDGGKLHFVYGLGPHRGIPIFFLIPEDAKTRGVDGVRDYVDAHPTDFIDMSQSTNDAVDRYSFLEDFLTSLGSGALDPTSSRVRIESFAQSIGVSPSSIDACYAAGGSSGDINNCIQQAVNVVVYQTNFAAPTQAQFLGGIASAANPATYAPYIASLLTVWRLFAHTSHSEYEYLPTSLSLADPSGVRHDELLLGPKVPTIRPPAAASDVLFFTIGNSQAAETPPVIVDDAPAGGVCARTTRFTAPLHFDRSSRYVHDANLLVTPGGGAPYRIPIDVRTVVAPLVRRSQLTGSSDGAYDLTLRAGYGFDTVAEPDNSDIHVAFPSDAPWSLAPAPHQQPVSGASLDMIATSASAPCLSHAHLQIGSAPPIALTATPLDARHVELQASLAAVPAGTARILFDENDPLANRVHERAVAVTIEPPPANVDLKDAVASLGDDFIALVGSGFERVQGVSLNGTTYEKLPTSTATEACFTGPSHIGSPFISGQRVTAQLIGEHDTGGQVFPLTIHPARPMLAPITGTPSRVDLANVPLIIMLHSLSSALPAQFSVRARRAEMVIPQACDAATSDPTAITLPENAVQLRDAQTVAVDFHPDALKDRAFGSLQLRIVDTATGLGSNWVTVPGIFARAPSVSQIACPRDPAAPCRLYGTSLTTIAAIADGSGAFVPPDRSCPPTEKGATCVFVPHTAHYILKLIDGDALDPLPDTLITALPD
jgi:hypothetical protein